MIRKVAPRQSAALPVDLRETGRVLKCCRRHFNQTLRFGVRALEWSNWVDCSWLISSSECMGWTFTAAGSRLFSRFCLRVRSKVGEGKCLGPLESISWDSAVMHVT